MGQQQAEHRWRDVALKQHACRAIRGVVGRRRWRIVLSGPVNGGDICLLRSPALQERSNGKCDHAREQQRERNRTGDRGTPGHLETEYTHSSFYVGHPPRVGAVPSNRDDYERLAVVCTDALAWACATLSPRRRPNRIFCPMDNQQSRLALSLAGRYAVERELGQGGMATVYLATDVRHERKVALKLLRPELAAVIGAERFLAEIKTTASLQHPHILPLHDSGEADGTVFYVMPYVEGESLRDRLRHDKQLPVDEALRITHEVASALDYAHRHGVVHRDIKPENILLHDSQALVADFGIALAVSRSDSPTRMTETGMSLGTPHYMAPEQAMGEREITPKADIYALGAVLYEMLTGEPPFTGSTAQAIVARAVTENPRSITLQRRTVPAHVEAAVLKALEKIPADRFASAGEFARALDHPELVPAAVMPAHAGRTESTRRWSALTIVPGAIAFALAVALGWTLFHASPSPSVTRYAIAFPAAQAPAPNRTLSVSPDGAYLVYVGPSDALNTQLWIKPRDAERATPLAGTGGVTRAAFSPDGQWIAFVQQNILRKMPVVGGAAITLADSASPARGVAWLDDGRVVFTSLSGPGRELRVVSEAGGPSIIAWTGETETAWNPTAVPGQPRVLFTRCGGGSGCPGEQDAWALNIDSREAHRIISGAVLAQYLPTGQIVYVRRDGGLLTAPVNAKTLMPTESPIPIRDSVALGINDVPIFAVSRSGSMFVRSGANMSGSEIHELVWVDRSGRESILDSSFTFRLTLQGQNRGWTLSSDGRRLAIGLNTPTAGDDIWIKQLPFGPLSRLTFDSLPEHRPRWIANGQSVMYLRYFGSGQGMGVFRRRADGTGSEEVVFNRKPVVVPEAQMSEDGKWLVVRTGGTEGVSGGRDISIMQIGVDSEPRPLIASPQFDESSIALSPDGRWIAYESNETGRSEVYIRPFPRADAGKAQVSTDGGRAPLWAKNGRELFYVNAAREMTAVAVGAASTEPSLGERRRLFRMRDELYLTDLERYTPFDISNDGQRFLMARRVAFREGQVAPLVVTENWFVELRRLRKTR
jgi:serine/threonine protein kinase/Tol biopolymer transport system component